MIKITNDIVKPNTEANNTDRQNEFGNSFVVWMHPYQREGKWTNRKQG
ncbi:MAG: hypothetical protein ACR2NW_03195 [Thermodesulfobacteriota bacterium]